MKISFILLLLISSNSLYASLEGKYTLISGPQNCPSGNLSFKTDKNDSSRILIFGSQLSWTLNQSDKAELKEVVDEGCTYITQYKKTENSFSIKTERNSCPEKKENSVINETLELKKEKLFYRHEKLSQGKKDIYECTFKRSI